MKQRTLLNNVVRRGLFVAMAGLGFRGYRRWHLRWGATDAEVAGPMPGDELIPGAQFCATRAVTIGAPPECVWPWLVQMGFGRGGFYSFDFLDNLGRPSAKTILAEFQAIELGDVAAPMTSPPTDQTSFRVFGFSQNRWLGWVKPDSTWVWLLEPVGNGESTRLVTRLKARYHGSQALFTAVLMELADFPMMRRQLGNVKTRAERTFVTSGPQARTYGPTEALAEGGS